MQGFGHRLEFADFSWGFLQGKARPEKGSPTANMQAKGFWILDFRIARVTNRIVNEKHSIKGQEG